MRIGRGDIRRIADDEIERAAAPRRRYALVPVRLHELDVAEGKAPRVAARDLERVGRHVGGEDHRPPAARARWRARSRPTRCPGRARASPGPSAAARGRARPVFPFPGANEHRGRNLQRQAPELAPAGQIGDGLAFAAAPHEREERVRLLARQRVVRMRDQPRAVTAEHVRQQHLRVERDETGLGECSSYRDVRAHGAPLPLRALPLGGSNSRLSRPGALIAQDSSRRRAAIAGRSSSPSQHPRDPPSSARAAKPGWPDA